MSNLNVLGEVPNGDPVIPEISATIDALDRFGINFDGKAITEQEFFLGVAAPFMPDELPTLESIPTVSPVLKAFFSQDVQPNIVRGIRNSDERTTQVAHCIGRVIGAGISVGRLFRPASVLTLGESEITVGENTIPYDIKNGNVVDYEMGINGLLAHLSNLQANKYHVTGLHGSKAETEVMRGIASFFNLRKDQVDVQDRGISYRIKGLLKSQGEGFADLVIANHAHPAGHELKDGVAKSGKLLRDDGKLVATGPRTHNQYIGYEEISKHIRSDSTLKTILDRNFALAYGQSLTESARLTVAERIAR